MLTLYIVHETAVCRNPHNSSNWDSLTSLDSSVTNTLSFKMLCAQKIASIYILVKTKRASCWSTEDVLSFILSAVKLFVGGLQRVAV